MKIVYNHWLFSLPFMKNFVAITVTSTIILTRFTEEQFKRYLKIEDHEQAHGVQIVLSQPTPVSGVPTAPNILYFYIGYGLMFLYCLVRYGKWMKAYTEIPYEKWARELE